MFYVLGIESSCDELACAVVANGVDILSNVIYTQHAPQFGGVVPELAARHHVDHLIPVVEETLARASLPLDAIELIAVTQGPGLIGSLLVGIAFAEGLALALNKPLIGVNHVEAHLYGTFLAQKEPIPLPALGCILSGGHTLLVKVKEIGQYTPIGTTVDDAIGEAFDKVAAWLGLPYPGGPWVERLARQGNPMRFSLKPGRVKERPHHFSFSGLKTNVLYLAKGQNAKKRDAVMLSEEEKCDLCASFQEVILRDVLEKAEGAAKRYGCRSFVLGGGVSCNQRLQELFRESFLPAFFPSRELALDNAAMIAGLGYILKCGEAVH